MADLTKTTINYVSPEKLGYYDEKIKAFIAAADKADKEALQAEISAVNTALENEVTRAKAAESTNALAAEAAQTDVDNLETYVGVIPTVEGEETPATIVDYIQKKTAGIATDAALGELTNRVTQAEKDIDAIEADYLKAADKTELADDIKEEKERAEGIEGGLETRLAAVEADYLVEADKTALDNAIKAEKERAEGIEGGLETRLAAVEGDYLKKADKDELAADIKENADAIAVLNGTGEGSVAKQVADAVAGIVDGAPEAYNTLKEISDWIEDHPESVATINSAIKANSDAIDALEALVGELPEGETSEDIVAYIQKLVKAEEDRAKGIESGLDTRLQAVEAKFTGEESVDSKIEAAEQAAKDYADEKVGALANGAVAENTAAIETLNGDASTAGSVAKAVKDAQDALQDNIDAVDEKADANAEAILAINNEETGILAKAKKYADDEDAKIESRVEALEGASATHALASDLTALGTTVSDMDTAYKAADEAMQARLDALEAIEHAEITTSYIDELFA